MGIKPLTQSNSISYTSIALAFAAFALQPGEAHAYIDPGTGSFLIQMLLGFVLSAAFAVKMFWHNLKARVRTLFKKPEANDK